MILAVILWLFAHLMHSSIDVGEPVPSVEAFRHVATAGDRPTTPHHAPPVEAFATPQPLADPPAVGFATPQPLADPPAVGFAEPQCATGEEWQGEFGCVAVQLPGETIGRALD